MIVHNPILIRNVSVAEIERVIGGKAGPPFRRAGTVESHPAMAEVVQSSESQPHSVAMLTAALMSSETRPG